mmetsp:Transcript_11263/g.12720  ORF Transcript_11263/g.12720 Transcript_11263/m.12720 type:complete len:86 (+) Transcript_11263:661-918(+)
MEHPVLLPSDNIVDLNQLKKHLMNDATDPYTRAPLKLEDVKEMPELKARIDAFRQEKLEAFRKAKEERANQVAEDLIEEADEFDE